MIVDLDATLVGAHSEKEGATPNFKRGFGFHPMWRSSTTAPAAPGSHWRRCCAREGQRQRRRRPDRGARRRAGPAARTGALRVLVRGDTGSGVKEFLGTSTTSGWSTRSVSTAANPSSTRLAYCRSRPGAARSTPTAAPRRRPGRRADPLAAGHLHRAGRPGCGSSPAENAPTPAPSCGSPTTTAGGSPCSPPTPPVGGLADLEVRHRLRARAEDRIRGLKDTGLTNLPLQAFDKNQIWLEIVALAAELLTWTQLLAWPDSPARPGNPNGCGYDSRRRRPHHHHRPPPHPAPEPTLALGRPDDHRTAKPRRTQLNSDAPPPTTRTRRTGDTNAGDHPRPPAPTSQHTQPNRNASTSRTKDRG